MLSKYIPSNEEKEMIDYKLFLFAGAYTEGTSEQNAIIGHIVRKMVNKDWYYAYSDDGAVWRNGEEQTKTISMLIDSLENEDIASIIKSHNNPEKVGDLLKAFVWGKYYNKQTRYVKEIWEGKTHETAAKYANLAALIERISQRVIDEGVQHRLIYASNYSIVGPIVRAGINWHNGVQLPSAAVSDDLYCELDMLGKLYKTKQVIYSDIKHVVPYTAEAMITDHAEYIRIRNFVMAFTYR